MSLHPTSPTTTPGTPASHHFFTGVLVLFAAQLISACMGVFVESTYATYGRHWRETLFYSHFLGCFFSLAFLPALSSQLARLSAGPVTTINIPALLSKITPTRVLRHFVAADATAIGGGPSLHIPTSLLLLSLNALTQVVCISGVNQLSAHTTAVTVTVVLNIRKLVSFLLSCVIFGNPVDGLMGVGAVIVFASGALYGWDSGRRRAGGGGSGGGVAKELANTPSREKGIKRVDEGGDERVGNGKVG